MRYVVLGLGISRRVHRASERCRQLSLHAQGLLDSASSLHSAEEVEMWRGRTPPTKLSPPMGSIVTLHPFSDGEVPRDPIEQVILRRGSARKLRIYRSVWSSSLLCWTELHVVSERTSWIHRESAARPVSNHLCSSPTANY
jgi:hypothetical protein